MKAFQTIFFKQKNTNENVINPNSEYENIDIMGEGNYFKSWKAQRK